MKALSIKNLTKTYANGNEALKGIDLSVEAGDFYALLGPNGAGKTTAIGIISSLVNKSRGEVEVFGHNLDNELEAAKACHRYRAAGGQSQSLGDGGQHRFQPGGLLRSGRQAG